MYSKSLTYMNIFNAHKSYDIDRNTHCTDEEMEAQRSNITCLRSHRDSNQTVAVWLEAVILATLFHQLSIEQN